MAAISACKATVIDVTDGTPGDTVLGTAAFSWTESMEVSDYVDNTTNCSVAGLPGPITREGTLNINLQDNPRGALPFRAGQTRTLQFHVDETGDNYWQSQVLVTELGGHTYDLGTADPVQAEYSLRLLDNPQGFGSLASAGS